MLKNKNKEETRLSDQSKRCQAQKWVKASTGQKGFEQDPTGPGKIVVKDRENTIFEKEADKNNRKDSSNISFVTVNWKKRCI